MKSIIFTITLFASLFSTIKQETFQSVFTSPQIVEINATLQFNKCNNKAYIPIALPEGTKGWIYSITEIKKKESRAPQSTLLNRVEKLSNKHNAPSIVDFITPHSSQKTFNLYIMNGKSEADSFFNCGCYKYMEKYIGTKARTGYIENNGKETFFIGVENAHDLKNLRLKVEAVAVL